MYVHLPVFRERSGVLKPRYFASDGPHPTRRGPSRCQGRQCPSPTSRGGRGARTNATSGTLVPGSPVTFSETYTPYVALTHRATSLVDPPRTPSPSLSSPDECGGRGGHTRRRCTRRTLNTLAKTLAVVEKLL